ncbi:MAG: FAD binding domain-containing protein [Gammaproteobacteria bacterium]
MKPAPFSLYLAETVDEALGVLSERGDEARILAGGQSLAAMLNMRLSRAQVVVDISEVESLRAITVRDGAIEVGAAVTQEQLMRWPRLEESQPLLAKMLPFVGHYQTRQRGTVCGSLAHADPSSELPLALRVLRGEVVLRSQRRQRSLDAAAFQTGMMATAIEPDEMIVACRFPVAGAGSVSAFAEVSQRHGDFAIVAIGGVGTAEGARLGVAGVAPVPAVIDVPWSGRLQLASTLNDFAWRLGATDDRHATARYRRELVRRLATRLYEEMADAFV